MSITLTWHTAADERVCPICGPLDGHYWEITEMPDTLSANGQVVWDTIADEPRTHGRDIYNCRCWLTWKEGIDMSMIQERIASLRMRMLDLLGTVEQWTGMGTVRVLRSHGRFVAWRRMS
jgi:hypothetical protein